MAESIASLVKYSSASTALSILRSGKLRWNAPALFDDPFELSHLTEPTFSAELLLEEMIRQVVAMLFGPEAPRMRGSRLLATIRRWREEGRFSSEEEAVQVLRGLLGQLAEAQTRLVDNYLSEWRHYASRVRIACFSERHDNLGCWERYGDNHHGVALRFAVGDGHLLDRPSRLRYSRFAPEITSVKEQLEIIFNERPAAAPGDFVEKLLVKGRHRLVEGEWRCIFMDDAESLYIDREIPAEDLQSVYFGLAVSPLDRTALMEVLGERFPTARAFQAVPQAGRFEVAFIPVGRP